MLETLRQRVIFGKKEKTDATHSRLMWQLKMLNPQVKRAVHRVLCQAIEDIGG